MNPFALYSLTCAATRATFDANMDLILQDEPFVFGAALAMGMRPEGLWREIDDALNPHVRETEG